MTALDITFFDAVKKNLLDQAASLLELATSKKDLVSQQAVIRYFSMSSMEMKRLLLQNGLDPNTVIDYLSRSVGTTTTIKTGLSFLMISCISMSLRYETAVLLLSYGADVNYVNCHGRSALSYAIDEYNHAKYDRYNGQSQAELVFLLLDHGAKVENLDLKYAMDLNFFLVKQGKSPIAGLAERYIHSNLNNGGRIEMIHGEQVINFTTRVVDGTFVLVPVGFTYE